MKSSKHSAPRSPRLALFRNHRKHLTRAAFGALLTALSLPLLSSSSLAVVTTYSWDPNATGSAAGGAGTWNTTSNEWYTGTADTTWPNTTSYAADFAGTAGVVTLGSAITTAGLVFDTAGYSLGTSTFALSLGTNGITANPTSGTTTISGTITSLGTQTWTTAAGGTLAMGATYSSAAATNYNLTLTGAGTVNITGGSSGTPNVVTGVFTTAGGSTVNVSGFLNTTSSTLASTKFDVTGASTVNWTGTGTQSGIYNGIGDSTAGTLNVMTNGAFNTSPTTSTFIGNGAVGLLNITGGTVTVGTNSAVYLGDGYNGTSGGTGGSGTITISGGQFTTGVTTGSFVLGSATLGTGAINLNGGTFSTNRAFTGTSGKASINFSGGILQATGTALTIPTAITTTIQDNGGTIDSQTFAITIATNFTHGGTAAMDGGLTLTSSAASGKGAITLTGTLGQTGGLTISTGATISGNNTYTGPTAINAFVDAKTSANVLGATGAGNGTAINTGGTLRFRDTGNTTIPEALTFNGGTFYTYNDPGTTTLSGAITLNANTTLSVSPQAQASTTLVLSGGIADGTTTGNSVVFSRIGAAAAASSDVINITAASTYGGTTAITDALNTNTGFFSVRLSGGDNRLPVGTVVTLGGTAGGGVAAGSGRLILGDTTNGAVNQTLAGLTTSGTGTNNAVVGGATTNSTLIVNNATAGTFGGVLGGVAANANNLALTKNGAGVLTLSGANTYTGATLVNAGTLSVTGSLAAGSAVTVGDGVTNNGTLGGTGTVAGTVAVNSGSTILAGTTTTVGTLTTGALTLAAGSTFNAVLASDSSVSKLAASGTTSLSGAAFAITLAPGASFTATGEALQLITSAVTGTFTNSTYTTGGYLFTADYATNSGFFDVDVSLAAVPEPSTYLGGLILVGAFGWRVRGRFARRAA